MKLFSLQTLLHSCMFLAGCLAYISPWRWKYIPPSFQRNSVWYKALYLTSDDRILAVVTESYPTNSIQMIMEMLASQCKRIKRSWRRQRAFSVNYQPLKTSHEAYLLAKSSVKFQHTTPIRVMFTSFPQSLPLLSLRLVQSAYLIGVRKVHCTSPEGYILSV
jgi:hypothetical protein